MNAKTTLDLTDKDLGLITAYAAALGSQAGEDFSGVVMLWTTRTPRVALDALDFADFDTAIGPADDVAERDALGHEAASHAL